MDIKTEFQTNISGKVRNTKLPKTKALWPLFEITSNAIHAIEERGNLKSGIIKITIIRNGKAELLASLEDIEIYPINSFEVSDNGIGFTDNNFKSFLTAESDYKIEKGAKGIGRFVSLKAFKSLVYDSNCQDNNMNFKRKFEFKAIGKGIFNVTQEQTKETRIGTTVLLNNFREEYQKYAPRTLDDLAEKIVTHFLIYFIQNKAPYVYLIDGNGKEVLLQDYYSRTIKGSIKNAEFYIGSYLFKVFLIRVFNTRTAHSIHYCANDREVKKENLFKYIPDLGRKIFDEADNHFVYNVYITGSFLDESVDSDRTDFSLQVEEDNEDNEERDNADEITLKRIRQMAIDAIEELLADYLESVRAKKFEEYEHHIYKEAPQFKTIIKYEPETIKRMPPNLTGNKLDMELFKVQNRLEISVKKLGEEIFNKKKGAKDTENFQEKYTAYFEKFNDLGKANLARYIVHRKSVIDLLDKFIGHDKEENFQTEDALHNIFFSMRSESDEISYNQHNLWLIDERLSYHNYLASDHSFKSKKPTKSESLDRPELLIFKDAFAFVEDDAPHNSYSIVEFKRPERKGYAGKSSDKNPVDQLIKYIKKIRANKATDRKGKAIQFVGPNVPFHAYIVADFNKSLEEILVGKNFKKYPDGMGYFKFDDKYNAHIEVITYQKVLKDAKNRNKILFDKLGSPTNVPMINTPIKGKSENNKRSESRLNGKERSESH